jgi:hypothetical protein
MRVEKSIRRDPHEALPDDSGGSWPQKSVIRRNWAMEKLETAIKERYPDELLEAAMTLFATRPPGVR